VSHAQLSSSEIILESQDLGEMRFFSPGVLTKGLDPKRWEDMGRLCFGNKKYVTNKQYQTMIYWLSCGRLLNIDIRVQKHELLKHLDL